MMYLWIALGLIPFVPGGLLYLLLAINDNQIPWLIHILLALLTLILWGATAFITKLYLKSTAKVMLLIHIIPLVNLVLLGIQEFALHRYWANFIGTLTQIYIVPFARISGMISGRLAALFHDPCGGVHGFGATVFAIGLEGFLMMLAAAFVGCKLNNE